MVAKSQPRGLLSACRRQGQRSTIPSFLEGATGNPLAMSRSRLANESRYQRSSTRRSSRTQNAVTVRSCAGGKLCAAGDFHLNPCGLAGSLQDGVRPFLTTRQRYLAQTGRAMTPS